MESTSWFWIKQRQSWDSKEKQLEGTVLVVSNLNGKFSDEGMRIGFNNSGFKNSAMFSLETKM